MTIVGRHGSKLFDGPHVPGSLSFGARSASAVVVGGSGREQFPVS